MEEIKQIRYAVTFKFKNGKTLYFDVVQEEDLREAIRKEWVTSKKEGAIEIGQYIISMDEIQWIRIEGDKHVEEPVREELQNTGKKV